MTRGRPPIEARLNDSPLVAAATRTRVEAAIDAVGYVYNRGAAGLRTRQSLTIGLIITDMLNPFFDFGFIFGLSDSGWNNSYTIMFSKLKI